MNSSSLVLSPSGHPDTSLSSSGSATSAKSSQSSATRDSTFAGALRNAGPKPARKPASSKTAADDQSGGGLPVAGNHSPQPAPVPQANPHAAMAQAGAVGTNAASATAVIDEGGDEDAGTVTGLGAKAVADVGLEAGPGGATNTESIAGVGGAGGAGGAGIASGAGIAGGAGGAVGTPATVGSGQTASGTVNAAFDKLVGTPRADATPAPAAGAAAAPSGVAGGAADKAQASSIAAMAAGATAGGKSAVKTSGAAVRVPQAGAAGAAGAGTTVTPGVADAGPGTGSSAIGSAADPAQAAAASALAVAPDDSGSMAAAAAASQAADAATTANVAASPGQGIAGTSGVSATTAATTAVAAVRAAVGAATAQSATALVGGDEDKRTPATTDTSSSGTTGADAMAGMFQLNPTPVGASADTAATPTLQLHASVDSGEFAQGLADRVTYMVDNGLNGARLQVNPPQLGPIELRIAVAGGHAQVSMITHSAVTRDALEASSPKLREMLGSQGFGQVSVDISQRSFQDRSSQAQPYQNMTSAGRGTTAPAAVSAAVNVTARSSSSVLDAYA